MRDLNQPKSRLNNSVDDLLAAIRSGRIYYKRGYFFGKFNAKISLELRKIGAEFNSAKGGYKIPFKQIPPGISSTLAVAESTFNQMAERVQRKLDSITPEDFAKSIKLEAAFQSAFNQVDRDIKDTIQETVEGISVAPKLTEERKKVLAENYTENMQLYIKDWTEQEIIKLRKNIQKKILGGARYESMIDSIQKSYGSSKAKARFWARQESNLMIGEFKKLRYSESGIEEYEWRNVIGSPAHPVRPDHKLLHGTTQRYDQPPIVDRKTGRRANPGQDYGCRCFDVPKVRINK